MTCVESADTFLSSAIKSLLVDLREECLTASCPQNAVTPQLTLNWEVLKHYLKPVLTGGELDQQGHITLCRKLWPVLNECGIKVQVATSPPLEYWEWTKCQNDILACFMKLRALEPITPVTVTLLLSALFENAIGNVFSTKNSNIPFLLRDLLTSDELLDVFGTLPILVARILLGTPLALNVRNVCWHGFASPDEIHSDIAAALLVLISSFGEILLATNRSTVPSRPKVEKDTWAPFLPHLQFIQLPSVSASVVLDFIQSCTSVPNTHKIYWTSSYNLLNSKYYGECLVLLLPALEHTLRCAFCLLNDCNDKNGVAEQSTLYTTMDEILDQHYITSVGVEKKNQLVIFLGTSIMEMLMDMFHSYEGLRIRDKLSHGECHVEQIPELLANHVFWLGLLVLVKLELPSRKELGAHLKYIESSYSAKFHSISKLRFEAKAVMDKLETLPLQSPCEQDHNISPNIFQLQSILLQYSCKFGKDGDNNKSLEKQFILLSDKRVSTLYRTKSDLSVIISLRKIVLALCQVCDNCYKAVETRQKLLSQHVLRSRQRASYSRLLNFLPSLKVILKCIILMVIIQVLVLPDVIGKSRFLKKLQQYAENLASLSCLDKNRWKEMKDRSSDLCALFIAELNLTTPV